MGSNSGVSVKGRVCSSIDQLYIKLGLHPLPADPSLSGEQLSESLSASDPV
jgi:hypothetical protein